jgi:hypothetical protein
VSFDGDVLYSFRGDLVSGAPDPEVLEVEVPLEGLEGRSGDLEVRLNGVGVVNAAFAVRDFELVELRDNRPPTADAGPDQTVSAGTSCSATVSLDGSASSDPDGDALEFLWTAPDGTVVNGEAPEIDLPLGENVLTLAVGDGFGGSATDEVTITVEDTSPPTIISLVPSPSILWPPDHTMRAVSVAVQAEDNCTPEPPCALAEVSSNEPVTGRGTGATKPDWEIIGPSALSLRAERSGKGDGRMYSLVLSCEDDYANVARSSTLVEVPHDRGE